MSEDAHEDAVADTEHLDAARHDLLNYIGQYADGWSTTEGAIVTKFVVLAEVYTPLDGEKAFLVIESEGLKSWERSGLLNEGLETE